MKKRIAGTACELMGILLNILSLVCGLLSAIITFLACNFSFLLLARLMHHKYESVWNFLGYAFGIVLGLIVAGVVRNLIYKEPTRF